MNTLIDRLLSYRLILNNAIFINVDNIINKISKINLSNEGDHILNEIKKYFDADINKIKLAIIKECYYNDFYIEISDENIELLHNTISELILSNDIIFPWVYGRELYDSYFDNHELQQKHLDIKETIQLVSSSHKGLFQVSDIIVSPFGLIKSKENRHFYPTLTMRLWHCSDASCHNFHETDFESYDDAELDQIFEEINDFATDLLDVSDFMQITSDKNHYSEYNIEGLFELLVDCFDDTELKNIIKILFENYKLRQYLPDFLNKGSNDDIIKGLNKSELISIILIEKDNIIHSVIEELIEKRIIKIGESEIREPNIKNGYGTNKSFLQCSNLGIRDQSFFGDYSVVKLKNLIKMLYSESPFKDQLEWKLRSVDNKSNIEQKINEYINTESPQKIIKDFIFSDSTLLIKTFDKLSGFFKLPQNINEENILINKIVWKLGFNLISDGINLKEFWSHVEDFKKNVNSSSFYNDIYKFNVRSSAVNLFVSMEKILQDSLSFTTWALLSDHYLNTSFVYSPENARNLMYSKLNNYEYTQDEKLILDKDGKNTLFPLVQGFSCLSKICSEIKEDRDKFIRHEKNFPSFYEKDPLITFPFVHDIFMLDIDEENFIKINNVLNKITSDFGKGNIINLRNRLQHNRIDFPTHTEMINAIQCIEEVFTYIEDYNIFPTTYFKYLTEIDAFQRTKFTLKNYKNDSITFFDSKELEGSNVHEPNNFTIVFRDIFLANTNYPILFTYNEDSSYRKYWSNYPRKKFTQKDEEEKKIENKQEFPTKSI